MLHQAIMMEIILVYTFLFSIGSFFGWIIEVIFRRFFSSKNPERKWVNPGFCAGPYLPIYGIALCVLFFFATLGEDMGFTTTVGNQILMFILMSLIICAIELIGGLILLKQFNARLWDYRQNWGNICGLICPKFAFFWIILAAGYYWIIHPLCNEWLIWLSQHLAFSFFVGLFMGIFIVDVLYSGSYLLQMRKFGKNNKVIVEQDRVKTELTTKHKGSKNFLLPYGSAKSLNTHLERSLAHHSQTLYANKTRKKSQRKKS